MLSSESVKIAQDYARISIDFQQKMFSNLLSRLTINPNSQCIDIGCGTGNSTVVLAEKLRHKGHVIGVDPDEKRVEVARRESKRDNIEYYVGKSINLPNNENSYDLIVSSFVMHWVPYEEKIETYKKVGQLLKSGGVFLCVEVGPLLTPLFRKALGYANKEDRDKTNNALHFVTAEENEEIFRSLDFEVVHIEGVIASQRFSSIDAFCHWFEATIHGLINAKEMNESMKNDEDIQVEEDGSVIDHWDLNYIIVKKK